MSQTFIKVISISGSDITDRMYKFLTIYGQRQQLTHASHGKKKNKGKGRKEINTKQEARVQRESRMIPQLIYSVEQYERHLIQLSRKSRVDFMQYMKRSTSRDFKIEISLLNEESSSEDEKEVRSSSLPRMCVILIYNRTQAVLVKHHQKELDCHSSYKNMIITTGHDFIIVYFYITKTSSFFQLYIFTKALVILHTF